MSENLALLFERATRGETIEACVIGTDCYDGLSKPDIRDFEPCDWPINTPIPWAEARPWLDHEYDSGFGGADCPPVYAWTATGVFFIAEYDGATSVAEVPRHPTECRAEFPS